MFTAAFANPDSSVQATFIANECTELVPALLQEDHECHLPMLADSSKNGKKVATAHLTMKASRHAIACVRCMPAGSVLSRTGS